MCAIIHWKKGGACAVIVMLGAGAVYAEECCAVKPKEIRC